jgi:hypothetical protein
VINIGAELDKLQDSLEAMNTVSYTIDSQVHLDDLIRASHRVLALGFVTHMTNVANANPKRYQHMYEWGGLGKPTQRLWRHTLAGRGGHRVASFKFLESKTTVPVEPELQAVGVEERHVFRKKAAVLEYGLPVRIQRIDSEFLVFLFAGMGGRLVTTRGPVTIPRQGDPETWGAFTKQFTLWWHLPEAQQLLQRSIERPAASRISRWLKNELVRLNKRKSKRKVKFGIVAIDRGMRQRLLNDLESHYSKIAYNEGVDDVDVE